MLPTEPIIVTQEPDPSGGLLTGDLGMVVLRSLLENGVGYVVSSWQERPTPIDAAIDDARASILERRGVVLRRLRSLAGLQPLVTSPSGGVGGVAGAAHRGAVVFAGRRGLRPTLETFVRLQVPGGVVGICFDEEAVLIADAIVIDPAPTARGLSRALDVAFAASVATNRPALVLVRERLLGMRGTLRMRPDLLPNDAADRDAAMPRGMSLADAARVTGLVHARRGPSTTVAQPVLVTVEPLAHGAERALAHLAAHLQAAGARPLADDVALVVTSAPGLDPCVGGIAELCAAAPSIGLLAGPGSPLRRRFDDAVALTLDPGTARGEQLEAAIAGWLLASSEELDDVTRTVLETCAAAGSNRRAAHAARVPRRGEVLHRGVSPIVAAGLTLAQGVIGVPSRVDDAHPTYQTDTGVALTIAPAAIFVEHGAASGAVTAMPGVYLVTGAAAGIAEAAGRMGASVEYVDGSSPRSIGRAIGAACAAPRTVPHVVIVADVQRVAPAARGVFGIDPELIGTERLATSAVPASATVLVELGEELIGGPSELVLDHPAARAAADPLRELSPATWDLYRPSTRPGRGASFAWMLRRRATKAFAGVDL
ncbi:MAG: hypothetical protein JWM90_488 [Thermoleophilia bacterium]|nr:hypothetical protein [Thermoleophilia bacterium]